MVDTAMTGNDLLEAAPTTADTDIAETTNGVSSITINGSKSESSKRLPIAVTKPIPYTFDLGNLAVFDANPLQSTTPSNLHAAARDCAQSLLNQLLTTVPITSTPNGVHLALPAPTFPLPREKPLPTPKPPTRWERFAAAKGIQKKARDGKMQYDEASGEWVPKYGFGRKKDDEDWLVEVDDQKGEKEEGGVRRERRAERKERVKRQERRERANTARAGKGKG